MFHGSFSFRKKIIRYSTKSRKVDSSKIDLDHLTRLIQTNQLTEAYNYSIKLQKRHSSSAPLLNTLGVINFKLGKKTLSVNYYEKALAIIPNYFEALYNLGYTLLALGKFDEACRIFKRAANLRPESFLVFYMMGKAHRAMYKSEDAINNYKNCLKIRPNHVPALNELGIMYSHLGNNTEAIKYFRKILKIKPDWPIAHRHISLVHTYKIKDKHIDELELLLSKNIPVKDEIEIRYAYSKAMHDVGDTDSAYKSLKKANKLRKSLSDYDIRKHKAISDKVKEYYLSNKTSIKQFKRQEIADRPRIIFVLGMPRSGTTLVEQILSSHSKVFGGGEVSFLGNELYPFFSKREKDITHSENSLNLEALYERYHLHINRLSPNKPFFVDKMPTNFIWIGLISLLFPDAKIINVRREPMAVIWSNFKHYFSGSELGFSNDFGDILDFYKSYIELIEFWKRNINQKIYDLDYEKLTERPAREIRLLLDFCNLPWEENCMQSHKTDRLIKTASRNQVRQPIYKGSSNEWKKYRKYMGNLETEVDAIKANIG